MFTFIEESLTFSPEQKKAITNNLKRDLKSFDEHKVAAESQRYKKPWVQSTELSDVIADISRQSEAIIHSINKTISSFANRSVSQQQDNYLREAFVLKNFTKSGKSPHFFLTPPPPL